MIYVMLSKENSVLQKNIANFLKVFKYDNIQYKLIFNPKHIFESTIADINQSKDIVLWNPYVAYSNLDLVKQFQNSIVILEKPTLLIQKISEANPINENVAINHGFFLIYINPDREEITNNEWKLVVQEDQYVMTMENLLNLIKTDESNLRKEIKVYSDVFDDIIQINKDQINLS